MIEGKVQVSIADAGIVLLQPRVTIGIADSSRTYHIEEVVVDTGFTGWLTLPERNIQELGLTYYGQRRAVLANEEQIASEVYSALISWHGHPRPVLVYRIEGPPLIGMSLLTGSRLIVESREDGNVTIEEALIQ